MNEQELLDYIGQYNTAMTPANGNLGVSNFQSSPNYQTQFGNAMNQTWQQSPLSTMLQQPQLSVNDFLNSDAYKVQYGNNTNVDPNQRFLNDPGLQAAIASQMPKIQANYAARGLGDSGAAAKGLTDYMYKNYTDYTGKQGQLYDTEYNKKLNTQGANVAGFLNQQQMVGNNFNNYQNQLANAAGMGQAASNQIGNNAMTSSQQLMQLLSQGFLGTGQNLAQTGLSSAENIASLFANQGVLNANLFQGTGAAMSQNMMQGSQLGAQLQNAQNRSNAQTQNSMFAGQGAQNSLYGINSMYNGGSYIGNPMAPFGGQM